MKTIENKTYKKCLTLARRRIFEFEGKKGEQTLATFIKVSKRQVLRNGEDYSTVHSDRLFHIIKDMEVRHDS